MDLAPLADWTKPGFSDGNYWVDFLIVLLVTALFVYIAARIVAGRASYLSAIGTVLVGNFLAGLVLVLVGGILGLVLAILVWGLIAAAFFRTRWLQGAVIGVVAALLWILVRWLLAEFAHKAG